MNDFKNSEGIELNIGDQIRGVNNKGEKVQGMLSTFSHEGGVVIEDKDSMLHSVEMDTVFVGHMKDYVVVVCIRDEWDCPNIKQIKALNEEEVYPILADAMEMDDEELEQGEEEGEICIIIKEVKEVTV